MYLFGILLMSGFLLYVAFRPSAASKSAAASNASVINAPVRPTMAVTFPVDVPVMVLTPESTDAIIQPTLTLFLSPVAPDPLPDILPTTVLDTSTLPRCGGFTPVDLQIDEEVRVHFQDVGALRLLSAPRLDGSTHDNDVLRLVYDNNRLIIESEGICGNWRGSPVWYVQVYVPRFRDRGWVGVQTVDDIWISRSVPD